MEATITKSHFRLFSFFKSTVAKWCISFLLFLPLIFNAQKSHATHMMGADITYRCIDTLKFEVTIKWYRDCRGIPLTGPNLRVHCSGGARFVSTNLVSIRKITPVCATEPSRCSPANTRGTGEGVEEHTYRAIVDFNKDPIKQFANCDKIIIDGSINARNNAITTGPSGTLYTNCMIDLTKAPCRFCSLHNHIYFRHDWKSKWFVRTNYKPMEE
jgi:hypothetical protein